MKKKVLSTTLGNIAVYIREGSSGPTPVIFLHGVYYDHHLWEKIIPHVKDRPVIAIDMPFHGESKEGVPKQWTIEGCGEMLMEILDVLKIPEVIAIGHSWGSMTILRAATKYPGRFQSVGLCNMPFEAATRAGRLQFHLQHLALPFRKFYTRQVARALYGKQHLKKQPELLGHLERSMSRLSNSEIKATDRAVILRAEDTTSLLKSLQVPAMALKGKEDYVPAPPGIETRLADGGHISPLEVPEEVVLFVSKLIHNSVRK